MCWSATSPSSGGATGTRPSAVARLAASSGRSLRAPAPTVAGQLWIQQVMSAGQATIALACGADVLIGQGGEAGGHSGDVAALVLVPQVADLAGDVPVVAAGGIADGRGIAAAFALGAQGVVM